MDRNDKVFTFLFNIYKIVMHKKMSHPDEIQNTDVITKQFRNVFAKAVQP